MRTIDILQDRHVPFQATLTKVSAGAVTLACASIYVVYLLSLYTIYTFMGGDGDVRDWRDVPDMPVVFRKGEK